RSAGDFDHRIALVDPGTDPRGHRVRTFASAPGPRTERRHHRFRAGGVDPGHVVQQAHGRFDRDVTDRALGQQVSTAHPAEAVDPGGVDVREPFAVARADRCRAALYEARPWRFDRLAVERGAVLAYGRVDVTQRAEAAVRELDVGSRAPRRGHHIVEVLGQSATGRDLHALHGHPGRDHDDPLL